jgi:hypothetical protein
MRRTVTIGALVLCGAIALAGCTNNSARASSRSTVGLKVTPGLEAALLAAGAAAHHLPVSDFTGLTKGLTFYASDAAQFTYWAGAQLIPSKRSMAAQVAVQDDGAYDLFTMYGPSLKWVAYEDGLGTTRGAHCAVVVPLVVRVTWHWSPHTPCGGPPGT